MFEKVRRSADECESEVESEKKRRKRENSDTDTVEALEIADAEENPLRKLAFIHISKAVALVIHVQFS